MSAVTDDGHDDLVKSRLRAGRVPRHTSHAVPLSGKHPLSPTQTSPPPTLFVCPTFCPLMLSSAYYLPTYPGASRVSGSAKCMARGALCRAVLFCRVLRRHSSSGRPPPQNKLIGNECPVVHTIPSMSLPFQHIASFGMG